MESDARAGCAGLSSVRTVSCSGGVRFHFSRERHNMLRAPNFPRPTTRSVREPMWSRAECFRPPFPLPLPLVHALDHMFRVKHGRALCCRITYIYFAVRKSMYSAPIKIRLPLAVTAPSHSLNTRPHATVTASVI
jgi:hypothetical protein